MSCSYSRFHDIYVKMYRLMAEFLIFKVTPWLAFLILFLSLKDRISNYVGTKAGRRSLTVEHYQEIMDSRIIIGEHVFSEFLGVM